MVRPMERTILQGVGNILFNAGWEIFNVFIGEPGILELANVETELRNHRVEASNAQLHIRILEVHLVVAAMVDKKGVN
jgi:hypothetical protein